MGITKVTLNDITSFHLTNRLNHHSLSLKYIDSKCNTSATVFGDDIMHLSSRLNNETLLEMVAGAVRKSKSDIVLPTIAVSLYTE